MCTCLMCTCTGHNTRVTRGARLGKVLGTFPTAVGVYKASVYGLCSNYLRGDRRFTDLFATEVHRIGDI